MNQFWIGFFVGFACVPMFIITAGFSLWVQEKFHRVKDFRDHQREYEQRNKAAN